MGKEQKLVLGTSTVLSVNSAEGCDNCGEDLGPNPVRRGEKVYCCEGCAFEARRSVDCGGRADSHITQAEPPEQTPRDS